MMWNPRSMTNNMNNSGALETQGNMYVPMVIEQSGRGERAYDISAGMAIYDTMQFIKPDVSTLCTGLAASMGAFLLSSGTKGKRFSLPNSRIMIHQPLGGVPGQASDIEIHAKEILYLREKLNGILAENTGKSIEDIARDTDRDNFMGADSAKQYGLIDDVLKHRVPPAEKADKK